jgi:hypothetical protein
MKHPNNSMHRSQDKKDKKSKKEGKKKSKDDSEGGEKDYLKEAMFGKKDNNDLGLDSDDDDDASVASEAGVDDSGAMSKYRGVRMKATDIEYYPVA